MFELNKDPDITLVSDIGPENRNALIIDNFYQNPDEVRQLALDSPKHTYKDNPSLVAGLPGTRVLVNDDSMRKNIEPFFYGLSQDNIWVRPFNKEWWDMNWDKSAFICNVTRDITDCKTNPEGGIVPHQDSIDTHFGCVVYLNTPEECQGGTRIYSYDGIQSFTAPPFYSAQEKREYLDGVFNSLLKGKEKNIDRVTYNKWVRDYVNDGIEDSLWKVELTFEMVYNRCILYESDVMHSQYSDATMFLDHDRIAQVLFM